MQKYTYMVLMNFSHLGWECCLPEPKILKQKPQQQAYRSTFFCIAGQGFQLVMFKTFQFAAIVVGWPQIEGKSLLLEMTSTSKAPEIELTCMPSPWGLEFMESEGAMQASEGEKQPSILPSYDRYMNHNSDHNNPGVQ